MIEAAATTLVAKPAKDVFAYVSDVTNMPAWDTDFLGAKRTSVGPIGKGATFTVRFKPMMGTSEGTVTLTDFNPNRHMVMESNMGKMSARLEYAFESVDGKTKVTRSVQIRMHGFMKLMQPMAKGMIRKRQKEIMDRLGNVLSA